MRLFAVLALLGDAVGNAPPRGLHLSGESPSIFFGTEFDCELRLDNNTLNSTCPIVSPEVESLRTRLVAAEARLVAVEARLAIIEATFV